MRSTMTAGSLVARLGALLLLAGCGASFVTSDGGSAADASVPTDRATPVDAPGACRFPSGRLCPRGQTCASDDGCNVCACDLTGILACTARACVDAGPPPCALPNGGTCARGQTCPAGDGCNSCLCDASGNLACTGRACVDAGPAGCTLPNGGFCAVGQTCPAGDGCNSCSCREGGIAACTLRACVDAGPAGCGSDADCGAGAEECVFPEAACGARGACRPISDCALIATYCACDGTTFAACPGRPTRPNVGRGTCGSGDAGVSPDSAVCAGASIGRGGGYCAGPADGPLPVECCTGWNCNQSVALCESLPPACPVGWTATVAGACWGPCVPAANCAPIACDASGACPNGWRCVSGVCTSSPR